MSFEQTPASVSKSEKKLDFKEHSERRRYQQETGESIEVVARAFSPEESGGENNVVFLPGWSMSSESDAITTLGQSFAEKSKATAYAISSRAESNPDTKDVLLKEAEAIGKFIKEKGLSNIVLAGHSQGGDKAIDLVTLLQDDPDIHIHGLVLFNAVGLYDQKPQSLVKSFAKDALINTPVTMLRQSVSNPEVFRRGLSSGNAVIQGILREIKKSGISKGVKKMTDEVRLMARVNPRLAKITVPVILIAGTDDPLSRPDIIMPPREEEKIVEEWKKKSETTDAPAYIDPREQFLRENIFPKSPYLRMVIPEKLSHHSLPMLRAESVANVSLYLLRRFERRKEASNDKIVQKEG